VLDVLHFANEAARLAALRLAATLIAGAGLAMLAGHGVGGNGQDCQQINKTDHDWLL
jgi:hypothetical protein